jgi:hypothetical protein
LVVEGRGLVRFRESRMDHRMVLALIKVHFKRKLR